MEPIQRLHQLGQSIWLDFIRRDLIHSGELAALVAAGEVRGVTSNPSIFAKAISESEQYTADLRRMAQAGWDEVQSFDALALDDIRAAAGVFLPLYEKTNGQDGYVSIEVNPQLADDTGATIQEASRLWELVNRPNVMIKIPATSAGILAIEQTIAAGINVNVTLIFSLDRYNEVMEAYLSGLETRLKRGDSLDHVASVASFFVSRIDTAVDTLLENIVREEGPQAERAAALRGKAAIASARLAYAQFKATFGDARFQRLGEHGARVQRPLWASTSTKNPNYPDTYYVDSLIGPDTVNTVPPATLDAFREHGTAELTLEKDLAASRAQQEALSTLGISMQHVTTQLEREGVDAFAKSYITLLSTLKDRARGLAEETGPLTDVLRETLAELERDDFAARLWERDATLWSHQPAVEREIVNRLGWLQLPEELPELIRTTTSLADEIRMDRITNVALLGMGGSSLSADVLRRTFHAQHGLEFTVLDTTNPDVIAAESRRLPLKTSLFLVSSKSGTTIEPLMLLEYFWEKISNVSTNSPGQHFVAITDPGTELDSLARERGFRRVLNSPEQVGGRYSALSVFGVLPAALMGIDLDALHAGAAQMVQACEPGVEPARNPGLFLGGVIGAAARKGRTLLTLVTDPELQAFPDWIEQLIAESSGKDGKGILPVVAEPVGAVGVYGQDRLIVYLRATGSLDRKVRAMVRAGIPVVVLDMEDTPAGVGGAFFQWEVATAVACHLIEVNPFDQPDVQKAKDRTSENLKYYHKRGVLPAMGTRWQGAWASLWAPRPDSIDVGQDHTIEQVLTSVLKTHHDGDPITLLLYLKQDQATLKRLARLRRALRGKLGAATTVGFGPRYLHSTGQLHKGGPSGGLYIVIMADSTREVAIPGENLTFNILLSAQAQGDLQALGSLGRNVYGVNLDSQRNLKDFTKSLLAVIENL